MIVHGHPGTGKSTAIMAFCLSFYGSTSDQLRDTVFWTNASDIDKRTIEFVRTHVQNFAQRVGTFSNVKARRKRKLIVMDEADSLTCEAQKSLKRILEKYADSTAFCFICNDSSKLDTALLSRCAKYHFHHLFSRLTFSTPLSFADDEAVAVFLHGCKGDARVCIHALEQYLCRMMPPSTMVTTPSSIHNKFHVCLQSSVADDTKRCGSELVITTEAARQLFGVRFVCFFFALTFFF